MSASRDGSDPSPEFGPSGYLPERASQRARKIVLRAPLGLQWVVASVVAGLVVVAAGLALLLGGDEPPGEPWVAVGPVEGVGEATFDEALDALVVAAGGRVRAFVGAEDVAYCPASHRLEAPDGRVWSLTGRGFDGVASLGEHPTLVSDGVVYVDASRQVEGPQPSEQQRDPECS